MADEATPPTRPDSTELTAKIGPYWVSAATDFGPRLTGLRRHDGPELFARLGDEVAIEHPDCGPYRFRGGHRLWAGPEMPRVSYAPDDHRCEVTQTTIGVSIRALVDCAGLVKEIGVSLMDERLAVDHRLLNAGSAPISIAPWAITQFRLGGIALVPLGSTGPGSGSEADRSLVVWPYTNLADRRLSMLDSAAVVEAVAGPPFKIGSSPNPRHLGYLIDGHLFTKSVAPAGPGEYQDRGAVGQVFVNPDFCELESAGPIATLDPGGEISHLEVWEVTECADLATASELVAAVVAP